MDKASIKKLISEMTLEEKAGLCSGADFWHTKAVERLGIPDMMVSDGPHGLRKQDLEADHLGVNDSIKAVCFPAGCAAAASFDREMIETMGKALGEECQAENVAVILGPAVNIKRSPLCGRNFEYYSEDPYLAGEIAASHIKGVQSRNVGTSLKHFLANNQEYRRMSSSSDIDERTVREIYLPAFERAVKKSQPWTVMCSYNRINGTFAAENKKYLTDILRDEWGFEGFVVSDWGAVNDRVAGVKAGLDLEMPSSHGVNDVKIIEAVKNGTLDEADVDKAVENILNILYRHLENRNEAAVFDRDKDHELSRKLCGECIVLLKNEDKILPLKKSAKAAFIGEFAKAPRFQGGGSSHINSHKVECAMEFAPECVTYSQGYSTTEDVIDEALISEAVEAAKNAEVAVIFAGLPDAFESEGFDRRHMRIPNNQNELIRRVCEAQKNTVIVLHNGSPVEMPWVNDVKAILEVYLGGQAVGGATVQALYGDVNPSGKLAETFPIKLEDNPSYLNYFGEGDNVKYTEGVFVGYRYYDKKKMDVLFPFGHGLSYTEFEYSNLTIDRSEFDGEGVVTVNVTVKNIGSCFGKEAVQLYVKNPENGAVIRPVKELRGFEKVALNPGESKTVTFKLCRRAFSYYETKISDWYAESGEYGILIGSSSRDIRLCGAVTVKSAPLPVKFTLNSTLGDLMAANVPSEMISPLSDAFFGGANSGDAENSTLGAGTAEMMMNMMRDMPIRALVSFSQSALSPATLNEILSKINEYVTK